MTSPRPRTTRGINADHVHSNRVIVRVGLFALNAMSFIAIYAMYTGGGPFAARIDFRSAVLGSAVGITLFFIFLVLRSSRLGLAIALWSFAFALWNGVAHQLWLSCIFWLMISSCAAICIWHLRLMGKLRDEFSEKWTPYQIKPGDVFTVRDGEAFAVVKVLAVDPERVHVRQYALRYSERPRTVKSSLLLKDQGRVNGRAFAHLPLDLGEFVRWDPWLMRNEPVSAAELKPLDVWRSMQQRSAME